MKLNDDILEDFGRAVLVVLAAIVVADGLAASLCKLAFALGLGLALGCGHGLAVAHGCSITVQSLCE